MGDSAPLFQVQTSSDSTAWTPIGTGIPVDIVSARKGTGTAVISPAEVNAGETVNYTVTYTATSTMDGGSVSLSKPTAFTMVSLVNDAKVTIADANAIKALIEEFDSTWEGRVTRTRDVVEIIQNIAAAE